MLEKLKLNLQLFAEGGEGGDGGNATSEGTATPGENIPAFIPEKAKKVYAKAMARTNEAKPMQTSETQKTTSETQPDEVSKPSHVAYSDLIKSDEYKEEHKAYMDKTISERLKKYKGIEANYAKSQEVLEVVAAKYGLDPSSEDFLDVLKQKTEEDDSFYEKYAMDNDISTEEARKIVSLERKVAKAEQEKQFREQEAANMERNRRLFTNAERAKQLFPEFDLEKELNNPKFVSLCQATNEDVVSAYTACHWGEIIPRTVQMASQQAAVQTANSIASNQNRPLENGLSSNASAVVKQDFRGMSKKQLQAYADEQRRLLARK